MVHMEKLSCVKELAQGCWISTELSSSSVDLSNSPQSPRKFRIDDRLVAIGLNLRSWLPYLVMTYARVHLSRHLRGEFNVLLPDSVCGA